MCIAYSTEYRALDITLNTQYNTRRIMKGVVNGIMPHSV